MVSLANPRWKVDHRNLRHVAGTASLAESRPRCLRSPAEHLLPTNWRCSFCLLAIAKS